MVHLYETAELPFGDPRSRCRILADLGNPCSGRCPRMGARRGDLALAEGRVDYRDLGMGDVVTRAGKLCMAGGVNDSAQGPVGIAP